MSGQKFQGFTLIEILLVISIIGTLGTFVISLIDPIAQFKKGRDAQRKADLRQIQAALEIYRSDQGAYPNNLPACSFGFTVGDVVYMQKIPCDPGTKESYIYQYNSPGYTLTACLENVKDSQKDGVNNTNCAGGDTNWSYTLTNP